MFHWRITKYDPNFRNASGAYMKNEWSSFSDIGKFYDGAKFSFNDYLLVEKAYIITILWFMDCMHISNMQITCLEKDDIAKNFVFDTKDMLEVFTAVENNQILNQDTISIVSQLALREYLWCKLEAHDMYVHFGYDYYMYIGSSKPCNEIKVKIQKAGLFIEPYKSPYL